MRLIDAEHLKRWIMLRWESGVSVGYDDVKTNEIIEQIDRELTINLETHWISLADAIEAIASRDETDGTYNVFSGRQIIDILKSLPSAKSEKKKGKWIDKSGGIDGAWNYCSVCGEQAIDLYDYCPNCGANMKGKQDE